MDHRASAAAAAGASPPRVLLVGNPNVGKSVLFGLLAGRYVTVSNYPGTTVELSRGTLRRAGTSRELLDTPGINTLIPTSEDERATRDILLDGNDGIVLQVGDSRNLRRLLLLTVQLAEMEVPLVVCLNMADEADRAGVEIDRPALQEILGVPCVTTVGIRRKGLRELHHALERPGVSKVRVPYAGEIERAVETIAASLPDTPVASRSLALMLLAGDETLTAWIHATVGPVDLRRIRGIRQELERSFGGSLRWAIEQDRLRAVDAIVSSVQRNSSRRTSAAGRLLDSATLHPVWGVPILALVLGAVFAFVGWFGAGVAVGFLENTVFGSWINPWVTRFFEAFVPVPFLRDLFVGPYGLFTMALSYALAIILPIVVTFFLAFGALEDSGYLPRLAVILNRSFRVMGLNGKAVLPMVLGLGCDTMATLTARILPTRKERLIVTLLLALAVPCSAQLGVILGLLAGLSWVAAAIWVSTVAGVLALVGFLAARVLPGEGSDFILEIPPLRWPRAGNLLAKTVGRLEWYLKEAVPLFVLGTLVLFTADRLGLLRAAQTAAEPVVVRLLRLPPETAGIFLMGFLRRDFGAAGLFRMSQEGTLGPAQTLVALVVITLFIPCIANFFVIIKERGWRTALAIAAFIFPFALAVGAALSHVLGAVGWGS